MSSTLYVLQVSRHAEMHLPNVTHDFQALRFEPILLHLGYLVSVVKVTRSESLWKPLNTTVRTLGRPSGRTVANCMNLA